MLKEYTKPSLTELSVRKEGQPPIIFALCFPPYGKHFNKRISLLTPPDEVLQTITEGSIAVLQQDGSIHWLPSKEQVKSGVISLAVPWGDWFSYDDILLFCPNSKIPHLSDLGDIQNGIFQDVIGPYASFCMQKNGNFVLGQNVTMAHIHDCCNRKGGQTVMFVHAHVGSLPLEIVNRPIEQIIQDREQTRNKQSGLSSIASSALSHRLSADPLIHQFSDKHYLYGDRMGVVIEFPNLSDGFLSSPSYPEMFKNLSIIVHAVLDSMYRKIFTGNLSDLVGIITSERLFPEEKLHAYQQHLAEHIKEEDEICSVEGGRGLLLLYRENKLRFGWSYALTTVPNEHGSLKARLFITLDLFDNTQNMGPVEAMGCKLTRIIIQDADMAKKLSEERRKNAIQALSRQNDNCA